MPVSVAMSSSRWKPPALAARLHSASSRRPTPRRAQPGWTKKARMRAGSVAGSSGAVRVLVAAEERAATAPAATGHGAAARLDDVVGPVLDQARVEAFGRGVRCANNGRELSATKGKHDRGL